MPGRLPTRFPLKKDHHRLGREEREQARERARERERKRERERRERRERRRGREKEKSDTYQLYRTTSVTAHAKLINQNSGVLIVSFGHIHRITFTNEK